MDIKQLATFVSVVDLKSFSKTAERLFLTQPTISAHITALEKELDTKLIIRTTKEVYPSEAGKILYDYARDILTRKDEAVSAIKSYAQEMQGNIHIAASTIPSQYILPSLIAAFRQKYPKVSFHILHCDSQEVVDKVLSHQADLGMTGTRLERSKCVYEYLADDRMVVIAPNTPEYQKYKKQGFSAKDLLHLPLILREEGSGTRMETENILKKAGMRLEDLHIVAQMDDPESIKNSVSHGLGISVISQRAAQEYERFGVVLSFEFTDIDMDRRLYLVRHKSCHPASVAARAFVDFCRESAPVKS